MVGRGHDLGEVDQGHTASSCSAEDHPAPAGGVAADAIPGGRALTVHATPGQRNRGGHKPTFPLGMPQRVCRACRLFFDTLQFRCTNCAGETVPTRVFNQKERA